MRLDDLWMLKVVRDHTCTHTHTHNRNICLPFPPSVHSWSGHLESRFSAKPNSSSGSSTTKNWLSQTPSQPSATCRQTYPRWSTMMTQWRGNRLAGPVGQAPDWPSGCEVMLCLFLSSSFKPSHPISLPKRMTETTGLTCTV